jgi:hypothetical protein
VNSKTSQASPYFPAWRLRFNGDFTYQADLVKFYRR